VQHVGAAGHRLGFQGFQRPFGVGFHGQNAAHVIFDGDAVDDGQAAGFFPQQQNGASVGASLRHHPARGIGGGDEEFFANVAAANDQAQGTGRHLDGAAPAFVLAVFHGGVARRVVAGADVHRGGHGMMPTSISTGPPAAGRRATANAINKPPQSRILHLFSVPQFIL